MVDTTLLVGGSRDGQRLKFQPNCPHVELPVESSLRTSYRFDHRVPQNSCGPLVELEDYRREVVRGESEDFVFWVYCKMSPDEALRKLFENYRPEDRSSA